MIILPAIDLIGGCAVRLEKGDYSKKTVYSQNPSDVARGFAEKGAQYLHLVDLDGARSGRTDNFDTVKKKSCRRAGCLPSSAEGYAALTR